MEGEMKVKGEAMLSLPLFILKKHGKDKYNRWLDTLSPEARKVYGSPIHKSDWYSLKEMLADPTGKMCELFYNCSTRGAWDCGRYSAEYGLKGLYKVLVKLSSPQVLIKRATSIIRNYYRPTELEIVENDEGRIVVHITKFPDSDEFIENRIAGWMQRAVEITGCKHVSVKITQSLACHDKCTEYRISYK